MGCLMHTGLNPGAARSRGGSRSGYHNLKVCGPEQSGFASRQPCACLAHHDRLKQAIHAPQGQWHITILPVR